ncbi:MAG: Fe-S protein [Hyphomicrobiales bacterium]|nr:Fe-S protein [Hyphomicrobiales bacterium]MCP5370350.1 Fe-S protein [Hyphomicrobiales bacterium]
MRSPSQHRPYHWGPFPAEALPRDRAVIAAESAAPRRPRPALPPLDDGPLARAARRYRDLFAGMADGKVAAAVAPVPADPARRAQDIKGGAYFLNAAQVGICAIPDSAWFDGAAADGATHAVVILVEHGRVPEAGNPARDWVAPAVEETGRMRAAEIAVCVAGQVRQMGFAARAHLWGGGDLDPERLAVLAGLAVRGAGGALANPFLGTGFSLAVVASTYPMAVDLPLAPGTGRVRGLRYWWGINGAESGRERNRRAGRPSHASRYPMEQVRRVDVPTTLILDDEVPRVPKRAAFFERALRGDLGERTVAERGRFAYKHPFAMGMMGPIPAMAPLQDGPVAAVDTSIYSDPAANARAVKALSYFLGADLTGICRVPDYAWFSHHKDGTAIAPYHRYAVVMLIDQEFDTMEGASGDDWISGAQSMRAYMRGAEIAGIMADCLRDLGFPARPQTNVDSDVQQIPLVLLAGLGEMSRIGELVLNPFVGPRFKSVVLTTDMPLEVDKPIDFGLQGFCSNCWKCARECPCDAIPFGPKVMFNGYETWKPDVERCARYRLTNARGSACGRCMKTCPLNKVVTADGPQVTRLASWMGIHARWAKPLMVPVARWLDDRLGHGRRNPAKKWWLDLEVVDGVCVEPRATNRRDIDPDKTWDAAAQRIAFYNADAMPPPDHAGPWPVDRKAALAAAALLETPAEARARRTRGGPPPGHYRPRPPAGDRPAD